MKFSDFKILLESVTAGDRKLPDDSILFITIHQAIKRTAVETKPLQLMTNDIRDEIFFLVEEGYAIRLPNAIVSVDSEIDIDDDLIYAVAYATASLVGNGKNFAMYENGFSTQINNYRWARYNTKLNMCEGE